MPFAGSLQVLREAIPCQGLVKFRLLLPGAAGKTRRSLLTDYRSGRPAASRAYGSGAQARPSAIGPAWMSRRPSTPRGRSPPPGRWRRRRRRPRARPASPGPPAAPSARRGSAPPPSTEGRGRPPGSRRGAPSPGSGRPAWAPCRRRRAGRATPGASLFVFVSITASRGASWSAVKTNRPSVESAMRWACARHRHHGRDLPCRHVDDAHRSRAHVRRVGRPAVAGEDQHVRLLLAGGQACRRPCSCAGRGP